jgi:hypothetical protein
MRDEAIRKIHTEVVTINGESEAWDADGNVVVLDEDKIQTEIAVRQAEYDALDYSRKRKIEYPSIESQLDDLYHNGIDGWKASIKVTKDKYPK